MHWILWILFKSPESKVVDLFMSEKYLALMSLRCPWMLRYAAGVFLMNKKYRHERLVALPWLAYVIARAPHII